MKLFNPFCVAPLSFMFDDNIGQVYITNRIAIFTNIVNMLRGKLITNACITADSINSYYTAVLTMHVHDIMLYYIHIIAYSLTT